MTEAFRACVALHRTGHAGDRRGAAAAASFTPGSPGLGDPFFPNAGNGGYDVQHYELQLAYTPADARS